MTPQAVRPPGARRDLIAGLLLVALGGGAIKEASTYQLGTLDRMGPGLFPCMLGLILVLLGGLIVASRNGAAHADDHGAVAQRPPDWRGWACIIAGIVLFIVLGEFAGLGPATFACVFVAALGDRKSSLVSSFVLAAGCTLFAAVVFDRLLHFQLPFIRHPFLGL